MRPTAWVPRRTRRPGGVLLALALLLSACVAPAFDDGAYRQNAVGALESATSSVRTAAIAVRARIDDRITHAYAETLITETDESIAPLEASFGDVDPPRAGLDALRTAVLERLGESADTLAAARLAVRRNDRPALRAVLPQLTRLGDELEKAAQASAG